MRGTLHKVFVERKTLPYMFAPYKKDLHDPDNHDGVSTYLEPDILECDVKWALGSITMNKARELDPASLSP